MLIFVLVVLAVAAVFGTGVAVGANNAARVKGYEADLTGLKDRVTALEQTLVKKA